MPLDSPYTKKREVKFRGPSYSADYNERVETSYKDLTVLYNRVRLGEVELDEFYRRVVKEQASVIEYLESLESRVDILEGTNKVFSFRSVTDVDTDRFNESSEFGVPEEDRLTIDTQYGTVTLPRIESSSLSKLLFTTTEGEEVVPPTLETRLLPDSSTAETTDSQIDAVSPSFSFYRKPGMVWERNVIADAPDPEGARLTLYIKIPTDLFTTENSNRVIIHPFPFFGTTVEEISYSNRVDPSLDDTDGYVSFNSEEYYAGEEEAHGWVIPGGWTGIYEGEDHISSAGPKSFVFKPRLVTALRIVLSQDNYLKEGGKYIYSYGMSFFDLRYDKFLPTGKTIIKFDAPQGETITSVDNVTPGIYNVPPNEINPLTPEESYFSWRAIWETAPDSGVYTDTPVPNSQRVWIEVTLNDYTGVPPALSSLLVEYS